MYHASFIRHILIHFGAYFKDHLALKYWLGMGLSLSASDVQVDPGWRDVIMAFAKETARSATVANMANFASAAPSVERTVHMGNLCGA